MVKSVFFSFASDDGGWVQQFKGERYFVKHIGNVLIDDYTAPGNALAFGRLDEWLEGKIADCAAIFVFLSENYLESRASRIEFEAALKRFVANEIIFVPVMLDTVGKEYWAGLKADEKYKAVLAGYQYADFTTAGRRRNIFNPPPGDGQAIEDLDVTTRIMVLAKTVRDTIALRGDKPPPPPPPAGSLVLLGDPAHAHPDEELAANFDALAATLSGAGVTYKTWPHAWRKKLADPQDRVKPPATFLRIVTALEIADEARQPLTLDWINESGRVDGTVEGDVILWRPSKDATPWKHVSPQLRHDNPEVFVKWLSGQFRPTENGEIPLLLIIDEPNYDALEDAPYSDVVRMVCDLTNFKFPGKAMNAEEFTKYVQGAPHRKLVIAILDNNVSMIFQDGTGPVERFEELVEHWQDEIAEINRGKEFPVEVVWVAVMTRLAHLNPLSTWNKRTLEPIHVLRVFRKTDDEGRRLYAPDESSAVRVASFLKRWMTGPQP